MLQKVWDLKVSHAGKAVNDARRAGSQNLVPIVGDSLMHSQVRSLPPPLSLPVSLTSSPM
jgi:hypothetical protein